jgi:adenosylcobinamide kinase/adenosylcobinamide-phosphate guanylyltransferase
MGFFGTAQPWLMPMAKQIILVTGGARSGKSIYAEKRAVALGSRRLYIATAEAKDQEMAQRISEHKQRRGGEWSVVEEPVRLTEALHESRGQIDCALVDCLTLWLSNLLLQHGGKHAEEKVEALVRILPLLDFHLVFVTNEVGWGVVPDNFLARQFRDLAGWANQRIAAVAHEVVLMAAGAPLVVKKEMACP